MKKKESEMTVTLNDKLSSLVFAWQAAGSPGQEKFNWNSRKPSWISTFPKERDFINKLPDEIGRDDVRAVCESMENSITEKFLTVMIWGFGDRGYGSYRASRMLSQENTVGSLMQVYELCVNREPKEAYKFLSLNRIYMLGPSYGTKFISFCVPRDVGAPIFDSLLSKWTSEFAYREFREVGTSSDRWNLSTYSRYWDWVKIHSERFQCFPDEIELVLFRDAEKKFSRTSSWSGK
jgi:hypothetical protein